MSAIYNQSPTSQFQTLSLNELDSSKESVNRKFTSMLQEGFFYIQMPEKCRTLIGEGVAFSNSFHQSQTTKTTKLSGFGGYHDRDALQVESHYAERADWEKLKNEQIYTANLVALAEEMNSLGLRILEKTLRTLNIPSQHWNELTGNLTVDKGTHHFSFNHYRPQLAFQGLQAHKDFGYITILYVNKPGLEGKIHDNWEDVPPLVDHFIVNFGKCMEIMTANDGRIKAIEHRVRRVTEDRISFGVFQDGRNELPIYSYRADTQTIEKKYDSYQEYMTKSFEESYAKK